MVLEVKVLGAGCPSCQKLEAEARAALDESGLPYALFKVTDFAEIAAHGVMSTPALVMNNEVVSAGKIPKRAQILAWAQERETS